MRASSLRRRLSLQRASDVADELGGFTRTWVTEGAVFAAVATRSRKEALEHGRMAGIITHTVTIRGGLDLSGQVRFVDGGAVYRVLATEPIDAIHAYIRCLCEEEQV